MSKKWDFVEKCQNCVFYVEGDGWNSSCGMHNDVFESKVCDDHMKYEEMHDVLEQWRRYIELDKDEAGVKQ